MSHKSLYFWLLCILVISCIQPGVSYAQESFEWIPLNEGMEGDVVPVFYRSESGTFFAGGIGGLFRSNGYREPWELTNLTGFDVGVVRTHPDGSIYAGTRKGVYRSRDDGYSWAQVGYEDAVFDMAVASDSSIILATSIGVVRQDSKESRWEELGLWIREGTIDTIGVTSVAVTMDGKIWATVLDKINYLEVGEREWQCLTYSPGDKCVSHDSSVQNVEALGNDVLFSFNWLRTFLYASKDSLVYSTSIRSDMLSYWHTDSSTYGISRAVYTMQSQFRNLLFQSKDKGITWEVIDVGGLYPRSVIAAEDDKWICIGNLKGLHCTEDNGVSWIPWREGLSNSRVPALYTTKEGDILGGAVVYSHVLTSGEDFWNRSFLSGSEEPVEHFAESESGTLSAISNWLYTSTDGGMTWESASPEWVRADKINYSVPTVEIPYRKPCPYRRWYSTSPILAWADTLAHVISGEFRITTDHWQTIHRYRSVSSYGDHNGLVAITRFANGSVLVGGYDGTLLRSLDNGVSWIRSELKPESDIDIQQFVTLKDSSLLAVTNQGLYNSIDEGYSWSPLQGPVAEECFNAAAVSRQGVLLVDGKYLSRDNGITWERLPPLPAQVISATFDHTGVPYVGTYGLGVFKGSESVGVSVESSPELVSFSVSLYPNPTRGELNLEFTLSSEEQVTATLYNALGRRIEVLISERFGSGQHRIELKMSSKTAGVYLVELIAGERKEYLLLNVL